MNQIELAELIDRLSGAYRDSQVLFAAAELDLFSALRNDSLPSSLLAEKLQASERGVRILCDALTALGLLIKENGKYRNHPSAAMLLCADSPQNKLPIICHNARLSRRWVELSEVVRSGRSVRPQPSASDKKEKHKFAKAMAAGGLDAAAQSAAMLNLSKTRMLLDIGGGPGLYAIEFAKKNPELHVVILDDEDTLQVAKENISQAGLTQRISTISGDVFTAKLKPEYDFIFISNVVHIYSEEKNIELLKKCRCALRTDPESRIGIKDFFLSPDRTEPLWSTLFAVNMLVNTEGGNTYTVEEVSNWLRGRGLTPDAPLLLTPRSSIIVGRLEDSC